VALTTNMVAARASPLATSERASAATSAGMRWVMSPSGSVAGRTLADAAVAVGALIVPAGRLMR